MRVCCVKGCEASKKPGVELKYFKFPKGKPARRAWLQALPTRQLTGNSLVCSQHFCEADFELSHGRRTLKKTSVPRLTCDDGHPKTNDPKAKHTDSNHEEESSDCEESTSDKEDNMSITNATELSLSNKEITDVIRSEDCKLDSETETIIGDVVMKDISSDMCKSADSVEKCQEVLIKSLADSEGGVKLKPLDDSLREDGECEPTKAETNGCDPTDPLSCNGDLDPVPTESPPTPPKSTAPPDREKTPPDGAKPPPEPPKSATDVETPLDKLKPSDVIEEVTEKSMEPEMTVLDPKTGLMREERNSIESIQDSIESLGESTEEDLRLAEPVFVEISVDPANIGTPSPPDSPSDCMMIVENVQVDVDPSALLMMALGDGEGEGAEGEGGMEGEDDGEDDDVQVLEKKPEEPVSLLTSSDEDDVILEEPHIDCVSVSDETDEDDQPLTRLLRDARKKKAQVKKVTDILERRLKDIFWGSGKEFYCYVCPFTTKSRTALAAHACTHAGAPAQGRPPALAFNVCHLCSFQTPSRRQFASHLRKHREDKKFQCNLCEYRARHKMSLVYHVKSMHLNAMAGGADVAPRAVPPRRSDPKSKRTKAKSKTKTKPKSGGGKAKRRSPRRASEDDDEYTPGASV